MSPFTTERMEERTTTKPGFSPGSLFVGLLLGLALAAACFYLGHQFWPQKPLVAGSVESPTGAHQQETSTKELLLGENTVADIAALASKSVVQIDVKSSISMPEMGLPLGEFQFFFGPQMMGRQKYETHGAGSGVIIRPDGYILTNRHVIKNADQIDVTLNDGRKFTGQVVGRDAYTDLALVKINADNLPTAKLGDSKSVRPGDWAIAIGSPMALDHSVTFGIISALGRSIGEQEGVTNVELLQTDAAINPGNSGGPLLNIHGYVIGLNTAIRAQAQNIGFAIPIDVAKDVASQLLEHKTIQRPYLGIYMQDVNEKVAKSIGEAADLQGVLVARINPQSPAEKAGLKVGDVIEKVDGVPVDSGKKIQQIVRSHRSGDTLNMLVLRSHKLESVGITIGNYPDQSQASDTDQEPGEGAEP